MKDSKQEFTGFPSPDTTGLAIERTIMAAERTLMAWTRTSISLISFGFTIYKFLQYMQEQGKTVAFKDPNGPRNFGLALIFVGVCSLLVASIQYRQLQKKLKHGKTLPMSLAFNVAWSIILLGLLALTNILFQIGPF
jgi:putative membrane protein